MAWCTRHRRIPVGWAIVGVVVISQLQPATLTTQHPSGRHHRGADDVEQQVEALKEQLHDLTAHLLDRFDQYYAPQLSAVPNTVEFERCDCISQCEMPLGRFVSRALALEKELKPKPELVGLDGERMDFGAIGNALGGAVEAGTDFVTTGGIGTAAKAVAGVATSAADIVKAGETGMNAAAGIQGAWNSMSDVSTDRGCRGIIAEAECTGACLMDDVGQCRARTEVLDEKRQNNMAQPTYPDTPGPRPGPGPGPNSNTCNCNCEQQPAAPPPPPAQPIQDTIVYHHFTVPYADTAPPPMQRYTVPYQVLPPVFGGYLPPAPPVYYR